METRDGLAKTRRSEHPLELRTWVLARPHEQHPPLGASGQGSFRQRRHEPGAEDRRLAASRWAEDADERAAGEPGNEVGDDLLPSVEVVRVGDVEEREPFERAHDDPTVVVRRRAHKRTRARLECGVLEQDRALERL